MNQLTREEIYEKYSINDIKDELTKHQISFDTNKSKEQLLNLFYENSFERRKIYTAEELDQFSVGTIYYLCKRLGITKQSFKGFIPQHQKPNLMIEYLSFIRTCSSEKLNELSTMIYPSNGRFVSTNFLGELDSNDEATLNVTETNIYTITEAIGQKYRYVKNKSSTIDCIEFLYFATIDVLDTILIRIGNYPISSLTYDDKICLITWHILYDVQYTFEEDPEFSIYLENTGLENLKSRIIGEYIYPEDYATMLWILNTKCIPPITMSHQNTKYTELLKLSGPEINNLAYAYVPIPTSKYRILALAKTQSLVHNYILALNTPDNLTLVKNTLGIIIPPNLKISETQYLQKNMLDYEKILLRKNESGLPPTKKCTTLDLLWYTDAELFTYYDLSTIKTFDNRKDLLQRIAYLLKSNYIWHLEYNKSANPNLHVIMYDARESEPENPIICFGNLIYYKAYNIDELYESFMHYDDDGFRFKVPDGDGYTPDFTVSEIHKLINFLQITYPSRFKEFIDRMVQGILFLGNINTRLVKIKDQCKEEAFETNLVKFCNVIFILSMKMKKWKGTGYEYPLEWKEQKNTELLKQRDQNVEIALSDYIQFIDSLEGAIKIKICQIPRISYNFENAELRIGYETINGILEQVSAGNFCLAHASDILIQSAYIIWIKVLDFSLGQVNVELRKYLGSETQPNFDPKFITNTGHIDPTNKLIDF